MFTNLVRSTLRQMLVVTAVAFGLTTATAHASFFTFVVGGDSTTGSIQSTVDDFRAALGGANNGNNPGPINGGRREINWDGGGAAAATVSGNVLTAFTNTRGSTFTTDGTGFLQTPVDDPALTNINPSYATTFTAFSPKRIFTPVTSNITDVTFSVPGTNGATAATVTGFGAIFLDVDLANTTRMEFFDSSGAQILSLNALPGTTTDGSFSFLGAAANSGERIAKVRITTGNSDLGASESPESRVDVVAMDDFIYTEPRAVNVVPEPATAILAGLAAIGAIAQRRRINSAAR
jgi:PEP-CTERM motif-containing protein